jgi:hypothetical protein
MRVERGIAEFLEGAIGRSMSDKRLKVFSGGCEIDNRFFDNKFSVWYRGSNSGQSGGESQGTVKTTRSEPMWATSSRW